MARLRVFDTSLCLLSAHLSSGESDGDELKRNYDYSEIMRRVAFSSDVLPAVNPQASFEGLQLDARVRPLWLILTRAYQNLVGCP